jgi:hypothetical protein
MKSFPYYEDRSSDGTILLALLEDRLGVTRVGTIHAPDTSWLVHNIHGVLELHIRGSDISAVPIILSALASRRAAEGGLYDLDWSPWVEIVLDEHKAVPEAPP